MAVLNPLASLPPFDGRTRLRMILVMLLAFWWCTASLPAKEASREYQIKAVFLFNFTQFASWPPSAFAHDNTNWLTIGVLGNDPFGDALEDAVRGEKASGRSLVIKHYQRAQEIKDCQLLYISPSESHHLKTILDVLQGQSVLTVSDMEDFSRDGGIINLVTEHNKVHFRINLDAAKKANVIISSQLLRLAEVVEPGKD